MGLQHKCWFNWGYTMGRELNRLNTLKIQKFLSDGYYHDGDGLYLQVKKSKNKSWIFRYTLNGKTREMGLGSFKYVTLAEARQKRTELKKQLINHIDPLEERKKEILNKLSIASKKIDFETCAKMYINSQKVAWKNPKHIQQWENSLTNYAYDVIGKMPVDTIEHSHIMKILDPIWTTKTETASRVRNRIELILSWATVRNFRSGENPARWRGYLDQLLPKRSLVQKVKHMEALPYALLGNFMNKLRVANGIAPIALQFLILTATRTSEVIGAKWSEIDFENKIWTIPASRMKAKKEHKIPLSDGALNLLKKIERKDLIDLIFKNERSGKELSSSALLAVIDRFELEVTSHGFRSTFRDWCSEETNHPRDVAESALAHTLENKVEAAYRRGDFFQKRRILMEDWSKYCYDNASENQQIHINRTATA